MLAKKITSICLLLGSFALFGYSGGSVAMAEAIAGTDFETGNLNGWNIGDQTSSSSSSTITQAGTGVKAVQGSVTFSAPSSGAVGTEGSPYYQPAIEAADWVFSPYGTYAAMLQPAGQYNFYARTCDPLTGECVVVDGGAASEIGLSVDDTTSLIAELKQQAEDSTYGQGNPTDAAWITKSVNLTAGTVYTMSWNYIGTDYVPYNDGSITSLTYLGSTGTPVIKVNNQIGNFALLGFTNPGTGDYSTGTYGSTGWQISTYEVSVTGEYLLGFAVFNLDDTGLSPVLLIDSQPGSTQKNGDDFGAVTPNNPDAPTVPPTVTDPPATDPPATDPPATDPPVTDPPATDPPATDPTATDPPATDPPVTDPPTTDAPTETDPPVTEAPTTTNAPRPRPRPTTTTSTTTTTTTTVAPIIDTTTTVPPVDVSYPSGSSTPTLPVTGSQTDLSGLLAFCMLVAGVGLYQTSKRKK